MATMMERTIRLIQSADHLQLWLCDEIGVMFRVATEGSLITQYGFARESGWLVSEAIAIEGLPGRYVPQDETITLPASVERRDDGAWVAWSFDGSSSVYPTAVHFLNAYRLIDVPDFSSRRDVDAVASDHECCATWQTSGPAFAFYELAVQSPPGELAAEYIDRG